LAATVKYGKALTKVLLFVGCFFKKDGKCYEVGTTKKYVCSTIHCELDSTGDRATFTGLKLGIFYRLYNKIDMR